METATEVAASKVAAGSSGGGVPAPAGEYWSEALKSFLDHIPISSVPGTLQPTASPAVEIKLGGSVLDAIDAMYSGNAAGAVIIDEVQSSFGKYVDRDIGFVEFSSILLWAFENLADGLHTLSKEKMGVAVIDRKTSCLIGSIQCSDLYLLLDDSSLFSKTTRTSMEEFINLKNKTDNKHSTAENSSACEGQNILALRNTGQRMMGLPVSNLKSDTLKQAMEKLTASRSSFSFIVDEQGHVQGVVTTRDIISVFSPPCMDSRLDGGSFFSAALEQVGCRVENGQMVQNS
uniref:CBS domain-containing protein n=1 Tax=Setaria italica TaxID=4555 RepID=K3XKP0_SETIT